MGDHPVQRGEKKSNSLTGLPGKELAGREGIGRVGKEAKGQSEITRVLNGEVSSRYVKRAIVMRKLQT